MVEMESARIGIFWLGSAVVMVDGGLDVADGFELVVPDDDESRHGVRLLEMVPQ